MKKKIQRYFGEVLRLRRKEMKMTQEQFAERAGLTDRRYRDLENGKGDMHLSTMVRFAVLCDLKLDPIMDTIRQRNWIKPNEEGDRPWKEI